MTWAQIAIIPKNRASDAKVTASSITVLNMLLFPQLEQTENIHYLFPRVKGRLDGSWCDSPSILPA
jgi:hypothetical protein